MESQSTAVEIPERMKRLPLWMGKYPILATLEVKDGVPNFAILSRKRQVECTQKNLCHICGQKMWAPYWFVLSAGEYVEKATMTNGPGHEECMKYACRVCPYLMNANYVGKRPVPATNHYVIEKGLAGKPIGPRPVKLALVSTMKYRANIKEQYPTFYLDEYETVDWEICPQRPENKSEEEQNGTA